MKFPRCGKFDDALIPRILRARRLNAGAFAPHLTRKCEQERRFCAATRAALGSMPDKEHMQ